MWPAGEKPFINELFEEFRTDPLAHLLGEWRNNPPVAAGCRRRDRGTCRRAESPTTSLAIRPASDRRYDRGRPRSGNSEEEHRFVDALQRHRILEAWSLGTHNGELGRIDYKWRSALSRGQEIIEQTQAAGASAPPIDEWSRPLLAVCASEALIERLEAGSRRTGSEREIRPVVVSGPRPQLCRGRHRCQCTSGR